MPNPTVSAPLRRRSVAIVAVACLGLVGVTWTSRASACTVEGPPRSLSGYPEDGAVGVPTDVIPIYDTPPLGYPTLQEDSVSVEFHLRGADGADIPIVTSSPYTWNVAFTPEKELEPNSVYTLEAAIQGAEGTSLTATFTTGDGPGVTPSVVEGAFMEHYQVDLAGRRESTCGMPLHGTCVVVPPGSFVSAAFVDEFGQEHGPYLYREPFFTNLSGVKQGTNFECVRLRARAPSGAESDPVELCGEDAPLLDYTGSNEDVKCTATGVTFEPRSTPVPSGNPSSDADATSGGGCTVSARSAPNGIPWHELIALLGLSAAVRRRTSPRAPRPRNCTRGPA